MTDETIVRVPVVPEPVEVQVPPVAVPIEVRDVPIAVGVLPNYIRHHPFHHPLISLWVVSYPESLNSPMPYTG